MLGVCHLGYEGQTHIFGTKKSAGRKGKEVVRESLGNGCTSPKEAVDIESYSEVKALLFSVTPPSCLPVGISSCNFLGKLIKLAFPQDNEPKITSIR